MAVKAPAADCGSRLERAPLQTSRRRCRPRESVGKWPKLRRPAPAPSGSDPCRLLVVHVVLMITGDIVAYLIELVIERNAPSASLPAFLAMYFAFLWVAWIIAVRITEPRTKAP
jgi:hypothetical protein